MDGATTHKNNFFSYEAFKGQRRCIGRMSPDFHIFASEESQVFIVRQEGLDGSRMFSSLGEATRHLRNHARENGGYVVIHDDEGLPNRIPLRLH